MARKMKKAAAPLAELAGEGRVKDLLGALMALPEAEGEGLRARREELWGALEASIGGSMVKTLALLDALGLPRALEGFEEARALRALSEAARADGGDAFRALLDAVDPSAWRARGLGVEDYLSSAARVGAGRVRMALEHPAHGPAMGARRRSQAMLLGLEATGYGLWENDVRTLELLGPEGAGGLDWGPALERAAELGREKSVAWIIDRAGDEIGALWALSAAEAGRGRLRADFLSFLEGWARSAAERGELEGAAGEADASKPASRLRV